MLVFKVLKKLNSDGLLLPGLSRWEFTGVVLGSLAALALVMLLLDRRSRSRAAPPPA